MSLLSLTACQSQKDVAREWIGTWATAPEYTGPSDMPLTTNLSDCSLREIVRVSLGGDTLRMQLSNEFSSAPVVIKGVYIADALDSCNIVPETAQYLTFDGQRAVTIDAGQAVFSDALAYHLQPLQRLAVTIIYGEAPEHATSHRGSRTTSYIMLGECVPDAPFVTTERVNHWYNIAAIDVRSAAVPCFAILGNSITDGRGSTTNAQNRWPDALATALKGQAGVLNLGIGGNCVVAGGISQPGRERFDRDILGQRGVTAVVIYEGVNDIGESAAAPDTVAQTLICAYQELIEKAKDKGLNVFAATITPFCNSFYWSEEHEAARQTVNLWLRENKELDGLIDFDQLVRDPQKTSQLLEVYSDDWLHLNPVGYEEMGRKAAEVLMPLQ